MYGAATAAAVAFKASRREMFKGLGMLDLEEDAWCRKKYGLFYHARARSLSAASDQPLVCHCAEDRIILSRARNRYHLFRRWDGIFGRSDNRCEGGPFPAFILSCCTKMVMPRLLPTCLALLVTLYVAIGCTRSSSPAPTHPGSVEAPPTWLVQDLAIDGMKVALGYRRPDAASGKELEPLTAITKGDAAVPDAMVFHQLVSTDGKTPLSDEVATLFTPPAGDQAGYYGQSKLRPPQAETPLAIRYRIVFADVEQAFTRDVPLPAFPAVTP